MKTFEIPPDYAFAIGADGEYWVLANEKDGVKTSTFKKVYDPNPLAPKTALETAKAAGLVLTPWDVAMKVRQDLQSRNPDADIGKVEFAYFRASGKGEVFRQPKGTGGNKISKPGWGGDGWQHNGADAVVLISEASCHCIGKDEFVRDWILTDQPELTKDDLYEAIPMVSHDEFVAMQS